MIDHLSGPLKAEILFYNYRVLFINQPLFGMFILGSREHVIHQVAARAVASEQFAADDVLFTIGQQCFVASCLEAGLVRYKKGKKAMQLLIGAASSSPRPYRRTNSNIEPFTCDVGASQWFCEAALFTVWYHVGNLIALANCRLLTIDPQSFGDIVSSDLEAWLHTTQYARSFLESLNLKTSDGALSDIDAMSSAAPTPSETGRQPGCCPGGLFSKSTEAPQGQRGGNHVGSVLP